MENQELVKSVGQDKEHKEATCAHDAQHGYYKEQKGGEPVETNKVLPNTKQPFTIKK
jgi:hypothetical protein